MLADASKPPRTLRERYDARDTIVDVSHPRPALFEVTAAEAPAGGTLRLYDVATGAELDAADPECCPIPVRLYCAAGPEPRRFRVEVDGEPVRAIVGLHGEFNEELTGHEAWYANRAAFYARDYFTRDPGERNASGYAADYKETALAAQDVFVSALFKHLGFASSAELGCSVGAMVAVLRRRGVEAIGLDLSEYAIANAFDEVRAFVHRGDVRELTGLVEPGSVDAVIAQEVLEHIPPQDVAVQLTAIADVTRRWLIMTVPCTPHFEPTCFDSFAQLPKDRDGNPEQGHLVQASWTWWGWQAIKAGFEVDYDLVRAVRREWGVQSKWWNLFVCHKAKRTDADAIAGRLDELLRRECFPGLRQRLGARCIGTGNLERDGAGSEWVRFDPAVHNPAYLHYGPYAKCSGPVRVGVELQGTVPSGLDPATVVADLEISSARAVHEMRQITAAELAAFPIGGAPLHLHVEVPTEKDEHGLQVRVYPAGTAALRLRIPPAIAPARTLPAATIVVNTMNRAPYLRRLLASFRHLEYPAFEVVVVNGPSTDETEAVVAEFAVDVKVARCPEANLSRSRNIGIAAAAGEVVAFIDDDALPGTPAWLAMLALLLANEPQLGAVGGPVLHCDSTYYEFEGTITSDYGVQIFKQDEGAGISPDGQRWVRGVAGGNNAFRRNVLLEIGGFDEVFTYYLDETDVCLRTARAGWGIALHPDASIRHYKAPSGRRRSPYDIDWDVIARSDTYYAIKNAADPLPRRLLTALRLAPRKHFFREITHYWLHGRYGWRPWLIYLGRWARGVAAGLWLGLKGRPRTPLGSTTPAPAPFLPFRHDPPARRLRIGLLARVYPPHPATGGIARYTQELAYGLHALGHEVHVFTESDEPLRREGLRLFVHGVRPEPSAPSADLPTTEKNERWASAVERRVIELARGGTGLDLVESPNWDSEGAALRRSGLVPVVVRIHSPLTAVAKSEGWPITPDLEASIALERWLCTVADGVTSSTDGVVRTVRETMDLDLRERRSYARIPLGVPPGPPPAPAPPGRRLLFVGRLERRKGIHTLLAVLPRLLARDRALEVDLVGADTSTPSVREGFEAAHARAPWRARCRFHGVVDDAALVRFYRECTVFVAPSVYESFGLIYLEAMRYEKPVIGCRAGGIPEVVVDGETGLLVPPEDSEALFAAITRVLDDPTLAARLGTAARRAVETEFASRTMAERTAAFYTDVLAQVGARYGGGLARLREEAVEWADRRVRFAGQWATITGSNGQPYRVATAPGSALHLTVPARQALVFHFLGHPWSGVVSLTCAGRRHSIDLYRAVQEDDVRWEVPPADGSGQVIRTLSLEATANTSAQGRELWLQRLAIAG